MAVVDKTRVDQRAYTEPEAFWMASAEVNNTDLKANQVVIATFPIGAAIYILEAFLKVLTAVAGTSGLDLCVGTVADSDFSNGTIKSTATINNIVVVANDKSSAGFLGATATGVTSTTEHPVIFLREDDSNTITAGNVRVGILASAVQL